MKFNAAIGVENPDTGSNDFWEILGFNTALNPDLDSGEEGFGSLWQLDGSWDGYISLKGHDELTPCTVDEKFLEGHDFAEVVSAWPDPDWTPTPVDVDDYWRIIKNRGI